MLAAGTCGSDEQSGVGLDGDVDWFLRFLMTVFRVTFSLLSVQTCWRVETALEIFLTTATSALIFFVRL